MCCAIGGKETQLFFGFTSQPACDLTRDRRNALHSQEASSSCSTVTAPSPFPFGLSNWLKSNQSHTRGTYDWVFSTLTLYKVHPLINTLKGCLSILVEAFVNSITRKAAVVLLDNKCLYTRHSFIHNTACCSSCRTTTSAASKQRIVMEFSSVTYCAKEDRCRNRVCDTIGRK